MILNKESELGKISFNLSPTSLNIFIQSPLLFYLTYIAKVPDDTYVPVCYGLSGGIVHECLEKYAKGSFDRNEAYLFFINQWEKLSLDIHLDIRNKVLNKEEYLLALIKGLNFVDLYDNHICEEAINFPFVENEYMKIGIKGVIDLQATEKKANHRILIDYKTSNSINQGKEFERQALFYNLLIHKKSNELPSKTIFHYLKLGVPKVYSFSHEDIHAFEEELRIIANQILEYGNNISDYPIGEINDLFNSKKKACFREVFRRNAFSDPQTCIPINF